MAKYEAHVIRTLVYARLFEVEAESEEQAEELAEQQAGEINELWEVESEGRPDVTVSELEPKKEPSHG